MSNSRVVSILALFAALACFSAASAASNKLPTDFLLEPIVTGLDRPSAMVVGESARVYIAERYTGNVYVVQYGKLQPTPVVSVSVGLDADEGLLDLAWSSDGPGEGYLFLFYVDGVSGEKKIVRYTLSGNTGTEALTVLDLGGFAGQFRVGSGLEIGRDGKLYVSVGDMESSTDAQNDSSNLGKVLRLELDGTIPADNPTPGSAVWAKGFRDGIGLAAHPEVDTLYGTDRGPAGGFDEFNAVQAGLNYGWDLYNGMAGQSGYEDPLQAHDPLVGTAGLTTYVGATFPDASADGWDNDFDGTIDERDETYDDSVFYACYDENDVMRSVLTGADLATQDSAGSFFDPTQEWDMVITDPPNEVYHMCNPHEDPGCGGTVDAGCPPNWTDLDESADGLLYAISDDAVGAKGGLYRFVYDRPGPREVSPAGSLLPLSLEKSGGDVVLNWEDLGKDAWVGSHTGASQPLEKYTIWEGTLPISGAYDHTVKVTVDGTPVNDRLRTHQFTPAAGSTYYLVSAQGANLEGTLGSDSQGSERPGKAVSDYCDEIGWYDNEYGDASKEAACDGIDDDGDGRIDESCPGTGCGPDWVNGLGQPSRLLDQYGNYWTLHDFRGSVIHVDLSALNCGYCKQQAPQFRDLYTEFKGRGFRTVTVLMNTYGDHDPIPPANCAAEIQNWIDTYAPGAEEPVLCALDDDADGVVDFYEQYAEFLHYYIIFWTRCTGTPMNFYFDRGMFMYEAFCGKTNVETTRNVILQELPASWCE